MKKVIVAAMSALVLSMFGNVHADEELIWNPTHVLGDMVIGYSDFFVQEDGKETEVFSVILDKDGSDNDFFDQLIVIGIPDSDQAMVIGIPAGVGGVAATPIVIPHPANGSGKLSATPIVIPNPVTNYFSTVAHIDHWSDDVQSEGVGEARDDSGGGGLIAEVPEPGGTPPGPNTVAMEFDPVPEPPPVGQEAWVMRDLEGDSGLFAETPEPGGNPPGPNMFE